MGHNIYIQTSILHSKIEKTELNPFFAVRRGARPRGGAGLQQVAAVLLPGRHAKPGRPQRQDHLVRGPAGAHEATQFKKPREKDL